MTGGFGRGLGYAAQGLRLLRQPGLRRYIVLPLMVNAAVFAAALGYTGYWVDRAIDAVLPAWLEWLEWILWPLLALAALVIVFYTFTLVAHFIAAPFTGLLAEAVERHLGGQPAPENGGWRRIARDAVTGLADEIRKLAYGLLWALPFLLLFLIPGANLLAPAAWLAFSAWMLAVEYAEPAMSNHGLAFRAQRAKLAERRLVALGFGVGILAMTLVPVLNFVALPAGVAGATVMWHREWH